MLSVEVLLSAGALVNQVDVFGQSPLHKAARRGRVKVVKLLIAGGGEPSIVDWRGRTPAELAITSGYFEAADALGKFARGG